MFASPCQCFQKRSNLDNHWCFTESIPSAPRSLLQMEAPTQQCARAHTSAWVLRDHHKSLFLASSAVVLVVGVTVAGRPEATTR
mmetsp:Transcript_33006/g.76754  ORF Transcript_33006/g.76754 Transcript_33006/m.76754 type:complete len:84 (+) Transcript_33006:35-286(+)